MKNDYPILLKFIVVHPSFLATFAAVLLGCEAISISSGGEPVTDASTEIDEDTNSDEECENTVCLDSDLPCCEVGTCDLKPVGDVCEEEYQAGYSCLSQDADCGSKVYVHYKQRLCDGQSPYCNGEITDWGEWKIDRTCRSFEVCKEDESGYISFDEGVECVADVAQCPVEFDDLVCFEGGQMPDCPQSGCPDPPPLLVESVNLSQVAGGQPGEVVLLELFVSERVGFKEQDESVSPKPFTDIKATLGRGGVEVAFFNNYAADHSYSDWFGERYRFPVQWYLPHFWGEEMSGLWEISFEDGGFSGLFDEPLDFKLERWCLRFLNPQNTQIETEGKEWKAQYHPTMDNPIGFIEQGTNYYEMQIEEIYRSDTAAPVLNLDLTCDDPSDVAIDLIAANGLVITIKEQQTDTVPLSTELTELMGEWLTGRYQLRITSESANAGGSNALNEWSIHQDQ